MPPRGWRKDAAHPPPTIKHWLDPAVYRDLYPPLTRFAHHLCWTYNARLLPHADDMVQEAIIRMAKRGVDGYPRQYAEKTIRHICYEWSQRRAPLSLEQPRGRQQHGDTTTLADFLGADDPGIEALPVRDAFARAFQQLSAEEQRRFVRRELPWLG